MWLRVLTRMLVGALRSLAATASDRALGRFERPIIRQLSEQGKKETWYCTCGRYRSSQSALWCSKYYCPRRYGA